MFELEPDTEREKLGGGGIVGSAGGGLMSWLFGENWAMYARIIIIAILFGFVMKIRRMFRY